MFDERGDRVGRLTDALPENDVAALAEVANDAIGGVLSDRAIWTEEGARTDAFALLWPLPLVTTDGGRILRWFMEEAVRNALDSIARSKGMPDGSIQPPQDTSHPEFQAVLRVCKRAVEAAEAAVRAEFGGAGRLSGKRALENWWKLQHVDRLIAQGMNVTEASKKAGIGKSSGYRAIKGRHRKR